MVSLLDDDDDIFDDYPVDERSCRLLGPTALVVQALMGLLVILSLVYKRHRESPKRPWRIWLFDVSKQVVGQMFVHGVNVLISGVVAHLSSGNACVLYFLNILLDTTLGVALIYLILHVCTYVLTEKSQLKGFESGQYGNPPSFNYWVRQTAVYVFALTTMKLSVVCLFALWPGIFKVGEWLLGFLGPSDAAQVIFTMGLFPIMMNVIQFWLIDSIVKANAESNSVALTDDVARSSGEEEPLFEAPSDDEGDGAISPRPHDIENPPLHARSLSRGSRSRSRGSAKLSAITSAISSISPSPSRKNSGGGQSISLHSYPPSSSPSPVSSPASVTSATSSNSKRRRRSPPPPLQLRPRSPAGMPAAVNSAAADPRNGAPPDAEGSDPGGGNKGQRDEKEWAWDDDDEEGEDQISPEQSQAVSGARPDVLGEGEAGSNDHEGRGTIRT